MKALDLILGLFSVNVGLLMIFACLTKFALVHSPMLIVGSAFGVGMLFFGIAAAKGSFK